MSEDRMPRWFWSYRLLWRLPLLLVHILIGTPLTLLGFVPWIRDIRVGDMRLYQWTHRVWARLMLRVFGVRLRISGHLPDGPCLIVANHISWMDIVLLHALWPMALVAKAEIRRWPVIGWLSAVGGTIFIRRGSEQSQRQVNRRMGARLRRGDRVGIFPEGGINVTAGVGRFHPRLFASAIRANVPVVPVAIRYDRDGDLHDIMVFGPGENFIFNLLRLLAQPVCEGRLIVGPPLLGGEGGRTALARQAHALVKSFYES